MKLSLWLHSGTLRIVSVCIQALYVGVQDDVGMGGSGPTPNTSKATKGLNKLLKLFLGFLNNYN